MIAPSKVINLVALIGLALIFFINGAVLLTIFDEWNSNGPFSHGFLGFAVVLYILWLKRDFFQTATHQPSIAATGLLLLSAFGLLVSQLASVQQLQQLMLFALMTSFLISIYGFRLLRDQFFPLLMLALILPVWSLFQTPLRELSTIAGDIGPSIVGIEVLRDGYRLSTYGGLFDVEPACSGLGFFMVGALFAACVSFFNHLSLKKSIQFLVICLCFAIFANWVRIILIIIVGSYTHMQHFIVQDHLTFGWAVFAVFLVPLIYLSRHFFDKPIDEQVKPVKTTNQNVAINKKQLLFSYSILLAFIFASYWIPSRFDANYQFKMPALEGYNLVSTNKTSSPNWKPLSHGVSSENFSFFVKGEVGIQTYLANYVKQSQAHEMIFVENKLFDKHRWSIVDHDSLYLDNSEVKLFTLNRSGERGRLIAYWYVVNGVHTSSKKLAKLEEVKSAILGTPGATLIAFAIDYRAGGHGQAVTQIQHFTQTFFNQIEQ
ncbi:EpsI family protein [Psychromonas sp. psych-6C06]|nr:exosortase C-terminal domain/associated protein EpsI [Psychromonas sp. psych-6C06]PKF61443.1 EpsI family protein [Psychromonas sp. psych-6C06]